VIYRLDLENEIDFDTTTFANVNFDPTRRDGLLLDGQWRAPGGTTLRGQYARVHGSFRSGPFQGNRVPLVSDNLASVSVDMPIAGKWYLLVEARYVDDRVAGGDIANALERLDGYSLANLGLSYRRESFTTVLRVNNVTDRQYADYAAASFNAATFNNETAFYAAPERNYGVTVQYQF
jgi:iron complex outermembrane receptor protein